MQIRVLAVEDDVAGALYYEAVPARLRLAPLSASMRLMFSPPRPMRKPAWPQGLTLVPITAQLEHSGPPYIPT